MKRRQKQKKSIPLILKVFLLLILFSGCAFTSLKISQFVGSNTVHQNNEPSAQSIYMDLMNNYQFYLSSTISVAYSIRDTAEQDNSEYINQIDSDIIKLTSRVYSYNVERATSLLSNMLIQPYSDSSKISVTLLLYREHKRNLDMSILQYNKIAEENNLTKISDYDSIKAILTDKETQQTIIDMK